MFVTIRYWQRGVIRLPVDTTVVMGIVFLMNMIDSIRGIGMTQLTSPSIAFRPNSVCVTAQSSAQLDHAANE
jgi:hypothetical protein